MKNPPQPFKRKWVFICRNSVNERRLSSSEANINDVDNDTSLGFQHLNGEGNVCGEFTQIRYAFFPTIYDYKLIKIIIHDAAI